VNAHDSQEQRRVRFGDAAELYDAVRPRYPEPLFDDLVTLAGIQPAARVLEIGCGSGQASVPLARRGYRILCLEPSEPLAVIARRNLASYPFAQVHTDTFEGWPLERGAFDLVVSATAFHWVEPSIAYAKAAAVLRPGGALALWWSHHVRGAADAGFFDAVQEVYRSEAPSLAAAYPGLARADEVMDRIAEIDATGLFDRAATRRYTWVVSYDAERYTQLLATYSDHASLDAATRSRLFDGIEQLIESRFVGHVTKTYLAVLHVAGRREGPSAGR
jgi:SAM-dependent methyltransferase